MRPMASTQACTVGGPRAAEARFPMHGMRWAVRMRSRALISTGRTIPHAGVSGACHHPTVVTDVRCVMPHSTFSVPGMY